MLNVRALSLFVHVPKRDILAYLCFHHHHRQTSNVLLILEPAHRNFHCKSSDWTPFLPLFAILVGHDYALVLASGPSPRPRVSFNFAP